VGKRRKSERHLEDYSFLHRVFTLVEILLVIAIFFIMFVLLLKNLGNILTRAKNLRAGIELRGVQQVVDLYKEDYKTLPPDLVILKLNKISDPWGTAYQYQCYDLIPPGKRRKDRNLNPLNSAYDLWSNGRDQKTSAQINAFYARDDIIRANDGGFIGVASEY